MINQSICWTLLSVLLLAEGTDLAEGEENPLSVSHEALFPVNVEEVASSRVDAFYISLYCIIYSTYNKVYLSWGAALSRSK